MTLRTIELQEERLLDVVFRSDDTKALHKLVGEELKQLLEGFGLTERQEFGVRLSLEEAAVNAMKHGNLQDKKIAEAPEEMKARLVRVKAHIGETGPLEAEKQSADGDTTWVQGNALLRIVVDDEGKGFEPDQVADPKAVENLEKPSGRGRLLMRHYMTQVHEEKLPEAGMRVTLILVFTRNKVAAL
jgi:serine/threonine-protein kinase RsbW